MSESRDHPSPARAARTRTAEPAPALPRGLAALGNELAFLLEPRAFVASTVMLLLTLLDYVTPLRPARNILWHDLYRHLYYLPIIYVAVRYGLRGGATLSAAASLAYYPHVARLMATYPQHRVDIVADLLAIPIIGILTGALADRLRKRERLAAVGGYTSRLVHDVRGPLSVIGNAAHFMAEPDASLEERQHVAELVLAEVDRLAEMSGSVLDYVRGHESLHRSPCKLTEFVAELATVHREGFEKAGIEFVTETVSDARLHVDVARLHRVMANLLQNAKEALPKGGRVVIWASTVGRRAVVRVCDNGPGLPSDLLPRIFEPFMTHGKPQGTGLGLAIAQEIVAAHGGDISAANSPDGGAVFTLSLPL